MPTASSTPKERSEILHRKRAVVHPGATEGAGGGRGRNGAWRMGGFRIRTRSMRTFTLQISWRLAYGLWGMGKESTVFFEGLLGGCTRGRPETATKDSLLPTR